MMRSLFLAFAAKAAAGLLCALWLDWGAANAGGIPLWCPLFLGLVPCLAATTTRSGLAVR